MNSQWFYILCNLLKVFLLLLRVGVIKAHDELAFKCDLVVLVEQGSFCMANVKIPALRNRVHS